MTASQTVGSAGGVRVVNHAAEPARGAQSAEEGLGNDNDYGMELVLDLHGCDPTTFTRETIELYFSGLCRLIDMERCELHFWDDRDVPEAERQTAPKTKGTSAVQFILTSSVVIHTLDLLEAVYLNIFSCKRFDAELATKFSAEAFSSRDWSARVLRRR